MGYSHRELDNVMMGKQNIDKPTLSARAGFGQKMRLSTRHLVVAVDSLQIHQNTVDIDTAIRHPTPPISSVKRKLEIHQNMGEETDQHNEASTYKDENSERPMTSELVPVVVEEIDIELFERLINCNIINYSS
jgi:hypothetical protein